MSHYMAKKKTTLLQMLPEAPTFTLASTGATYRLRKLAALDEIALERDFGGLDKLLKDASNRDGLENIFKAVYRQIFTEDKTDFLAEDRTTIDDNGIQTVRSVGGWEKLAESVSGPLEINQILTAFFRCMGLSVTVGDAEPEKKTTE